MYRCYILVLWIIHIKSTVESTDYCDDNYDFKCNMTRDEGTGIVEKNNNFDLCDVDSISTDLKFTVMLDALGTSSFGFLRVDFSPPNRTCRYKIALVVNSSIRNSEDCGKHVFHSQGVNDEEVHTLERTVCISYSAFNNSDLGTRVETPLCENTSKMSTKVTLWYKYVYTGCYALRFKANFGVFVFKKQQYVVTDYQRTEIQEPKVSCKFRPVLDKNSSLDAATYAVDISMVVGSSSLLFRVTTLPPSVENRESACILHSERPIIEQFIDTEHNFNSRNCTAKIATATENAKNLDCSFEVRGLKNANFCLLLHLFDERCQKHTVWNPPLKNKLPCSWMQSCTRMEMNASLVEYGGNFSSNVMTPGLLCLPMFVFGLLALLSVIRSMFTAYRVCLQSMKVPDDLSTYSIDLNDEMEAKSPEIDDVALQDYDKGEQSDFQDIVLLYVKESKSFMTMMSDFRDILEKHCKCHVHDWYAPEEWNNVASIGGYEWVAKLLKKDCRIILIDTPKARHLFASQYNLNDTKVSQNIHSQEISDFRDCVFPASVDLAKRSLQNFKLQYSSYYVVRFEGFKTLNERNDPFYDLSPHVRYLIPHHLRELCSHLSLGVSISEEEIEMEERRLRQHLALMKEY